MAPCGDSITSERELLEIAEAGLHNQNNLAVKDIETGCLWLFQNKHNDELITELPQDIKHPVVDEVTLELVSQGLLKLLDLPRARLKAAHASSNKSPVTPTTQGLHDQIMNAKAFKANAGTEAESAVSILKPADFDPSLVLPWFIAAVETSISYQLASKLDYIPVNSRTWATRLSQGDSVMTPPNETTSVLLTLITLNAYVTTAGTLVLSFVPEPRPDMCLVSSDGRTDSEASNIIRLAPNGGLAKMVCAVNGKTIDAKRPSAHKRRAGATKAKFYSETWKTSVRTWLARRGLNCNHLDPSDTWVDVQLSQDAAITTSAKEKLIQFLWPACLCFAYRSTTSAGPLTDRSPDAHSIEGLQWFARAEDTYTDSIVDAQTWFLGKEDREMAKETARRIAAAQQDHAMASDQGMLFPPSPFYTRVDLQGASGVYPTPPDGVLTQPTTMSQAPDTPYPAASTGDTHAVGDGIIGATPFNIPIGAEDQPTDDTPALDADEDLFGDMDMDEENFGGNELSDADFNFFDEPDDRPSSNGGGEDSMVSDAHSTQADGAEPGSINSSAPLDGKPSTSAEQPTSVQTAGLNFLPQTPQDIDAQVPVAFGNKATDVAFVRQVAETPIPGPAQVPPLSPALDRKEIIHTTPSSVQDKPSIAHRNPRLGHHHDFDNVTFHDHVTATDAKYTAGGIFGASSLHDRDFPRLSNKVQRRPLSTDLDDQQRIPKDLAGSLSIHSTTHITSKARNMSLTGVTRLDIVADSDTETSSTTSGDDFASWNEEIVDNPQIELRARKRQRTDEDSTLSETTPFQNDDEDEDDVQILALDRLALEVKESEVLSLLEPDQADWSLARFPAPASKEQQTGAHLRDSLSTKLESRGQQQTKLFALLESTSDIHISIAQLVADQCALSTLHIPITLSEELDMAVAPDRSKDTTNCLPEKVSTSIRTIFPDLTHLNLTKYSQIQDAQPESLPGFKALPRPSSRKSTSGLTGTDTATSNVPFPINPQHVRVRRSDALWDLLPTALSFWEPLGLSPANGPKNVLTYCIYPDNDALISPIKNFLNSLGSAYEGCKLGAHQNGIALDGFPSNLIPVQIPEASQLTLTNIKLALGNTAIKLGKALASLDLAQAEQVVQDTGHTKSETSINNLVIYILDTFQTPTFIRDLCTAYWALYKAYDKACCSLSPLESRPNVVLQLLPVRYVASMDAPIIPDQKTLTALAREVYDRCTPPSSESPHSVISIRAAPSVQLEESIPRAIPFRLTSETAHELLNDCAHLHIGYAVSWDGNWLAAAWTDACGKYQTRICYNLKGRTFVEVADEIWQTTLGIMQSRRVTWRATISKAGVLERDEQEAWASLVSNSSQMPVLAWLMTIDPNPALQLTSIASHSSQMANPFTPVSTPQGVSPSDPIANAAATPSDAVQDAANDPEAHLVDVTNDMWGVILGHRLSNSNNLTDVRPCLASGFLINKGNDASANYDGNDLEERGPQSTGYNIVSICASSRINTSVALQSQSQGQTSAGSQGSHAASPSVSAQSPMPAAPQLQQQQQQQQQNPSTPASIAPTATGTTPHRFGQAAMESMLKEYLTIYRGLGMLARLRGMKGTKGGTLPWHIVTALNSIEALDKCM